MARLYDIRALVRLNSTETDYDDAELSGRPKTRADCEHAPRPCPWVGCRFHLMLDIRKTGALQLNFESLEAMEETCVLDVAERGGCIDEEIGLLLGVTRQRANQIVRLALEKLKGHKDEL